MDDQIIILNPAYTIRHDRKRSFIYSNDKNLSKTPCTDASLDWYAVIHPAQAMILSFFSHKHTYSDVLNDLSQFLDVCRDDVAKLLCAYIENPAPIVTSYDGCNFVFPKNILVKIEENANYTHLTEYTPEDFIFEELDFQTKRMFDAPLNITLMLNNVCATDCAYCYADIKNRANCSIPFEQIRKIIKEARNVGIAEFGLLGGEILLYPKWFELLSELRMNGYYPDLISTKVPLEERQVIKLKEILTDATTLQISLDSVIDQELIALLSVSEDYPNKIRHMLDLFEQNNLDIAIATTLTKLNVSIENFKKLADFLSQYSVIKNWSIGPAFDSLYIDKKSFAKIKSTYEDVNLIYDYIENNKSKYPFEIDLDRSFLDKKYFAEDRGSSYFKGAACSANNNHFLILPDGKVTVCEQLYWNPRFIIGDINVNSISEVWNSPRSLFFAQLKRGDFRPVSQCYSCSIMEACHTNTNKCWAEILKAYGDENWDFPDPRCAFAPEMKTDLRF